MFNFISVNGEATLKSDDVTYTVGFSVSPQLASIRVVGQVFIARAYSPVLASGAIYHRHCTPLVWNDRWS